MAASTKCLFIITLWAIAPYCFAKPTISPVRSRAAIYRKDTTELNDKRTQIEEGLRYWKNEDFVNAEKCFRKAANLGYSWGQYNLALCYFHGKGIEKNLEKAASLFRLAANQGNHDAQSSLGTLYEFGLGVEKSYTHALQWYQVAAKAGNVNAGTCLGYLYQHGLGTPKDDTKAFEWYLKAANNGGANAMYYLGNMYETGNGIEKNINEALKWYRASAEYNHPEASYRAFHIYYYNLSDSANGFNYLIRAAAQNQVDALYELGEVYYFGLLGRSVDTEKAFQNYKKAADVGSALAQVALKNRSFKN